MIKGCFHIHYLEHLLNGTDSAQSRIASTAVARLLVQAQERAT